MTIHHVSDNGRKEQSDTKRRTRFALVREDIVVWWKEPKPVKKLIIFLMIMVIASMAAGAWVKQTGSEQLVDLINLVVSALVLITTVSIVFWQFSEQKRRESLAEASKLVAWEAETYSDSEVGDRYQGVVLTNDTDLVLRNVDFSVEWRDERCTDPVPFGCREEVLPPGSWFIPRQKPAEAKKSADNAEDQMTWRRAVPVSNDGKLKVRMKDIEESGEIVEYDLRAAYLHSEIDDPGLKVNLLHFNINGTHWRKESDSPLKPEFHQSVLDEHERKFKKYAEQPRAVADPKDARVSKKTDSESAREWAAHKISEGELAKGPIPFVKILANARRPWGPEEQDGHKFCIYIAVRSGFEKSGDVWGQIEVGLYKDNRTFQPKATDPLIVHATQRFKNVTPRGEWKDFRKLWQMKSDPFANKAKLHQWFDEQLREIRRLDGADTAQAS